MHQFLFVATSIRPFSNHVGGRLSVGGVLNEFHFLSLIMSSSELRAGDDISAVDGRGVASDRFCHSSAWGHQLRESMSAGCASGRTGVACAHQYAAANRRWQPAGGDGSSFCFAGAAFHDQRGAAHALGRSGAYRTRRHCDCLPRIERGCMRELNAYAVRYGGKIEDVTLARRFFSALPKARSITE